MKTTFTLLIGAVFGIVVLLSLQQARSALCSIPLITWVPGMSQFCAPVGASQPAAPAPQPIQVTAEKVQAVRRHVYADMGVSAEVTLQDRDLWLIEKSLTIEAYGTCEAGVDYDIQPARIEQIGTSVKVTVPPPRIFSCGTVKIRYVREGGVFGWTEEQHNQIYRAAYQAILEKADQSELLATARAKALREIEKYARELGVTQVAVVIVQDAASEGL